jgi:hydrogenase maturation protease
MDPAEIRRLIKGRRTMMMCVGSDFGDDVAGPLLFRKVHRRLVNIRALLCETAPEKFLPDVLEARPEVILMVNAVDRNLAPGDVVLEDLLKQETKFFLVHKFPLSVLAHVIASELKDTRIMLLGVQVRKMKGRPTPDVVLAVKKLAETIKGLDSETARMAYPGFDHSPDWAAGTGRNRASVP